MIYKSTVKDNKAFGICKISEGSLPMNQSNDAMRGHLSKALATHLNVSPDYYSGPYVQDVFPKHVVYSHKGQTFKAGYKAEQGANGDSPKITIAGGTHKKQHVAYTDNADQGKESLSVILDAPAEMAEDSMALEAVRGVESVNYTPTDGLETVFESVSFDIPETVKESKATSPTVLMKLIGPGWGSSAYYSAKVLKEAAPVFGKGTHMMWNHQSASEEVDRPEGNLSHLAAVLTESSKWMDNGPKGAGLYANAKVFSDYAQAVMEKGPHIGVSINAGIHAHVGEAEGRSGRIADKFIRAYSTDFVTKAGAGGAPVVPVSESLRVPILTTEVSDMDAVKEAAMQASLDTLTERLSKLETDNARLVKEAEVARIKQSAVSQVTAQLHKAGITIKARLLENACSSPVVKEGQVDADWVKGVVEDFTESFTTSGGKVTGMGDAARESVNYTEETARETMTELMGGSSKEAVDVAMKGGR